MGLHILIKTVDEINNMKINEADLLSKVEACPFCFGTGLLYNMKTDEYSIKCRSCKGVGVRLKKQIPQRMKVNLKRSKNASMVVQFAMYCAKHPKQRFWQSLRNWTGKAFIYTSDLPHIEDQTLQDTFYKE
jgi:hypothetical protein